MKNDLFYTYLRIYPGKADVILDAINRGMKAAEEEGLSCELSVRNYWNRVEAEIIDALD